MISTRFHFCRTAWVVGLGLMLSAVLVTAIAQDGGGGAPVKTDDVTHIVGLGAQGFFGYQAVLLANRFVDTFARGVAGLERVLSDGIKVDDVRTHAAAVVDLAEAVRHHKT